MISVILWRFFLLSYDSVSWLDVWAAYFLIAWLKPEKTNLRYNLLLFLDRTIDITLAEVQFQQFFSSSRFLAGCIDYCSLSTQYALGGSVARTQEENEFSPDMKKIDAQ